MGSPLQAVRVKSLELRQIIRNGKVVQSSKRRPKVPESIQASAAAQVCNATARDRLKK